MNAVAHAEPVLLSWAEYVKFEEVYEGRRHELVRGRVRLMAGASERHDLTVQAIYDQLRPQLRGGPCRVFVQNRKIRTGSDTGYYPDLLVRCGTAADRLFEDDAWLIVEVLSPSNDPTDVTERLYAYQGLAAVETILFVNHLRRLVTIHHRTSKGWTESQVSQGSQLLGRRLSLDWAQVWTDVDAEATTD
jgi:Uma2 family endonuclease